MAEQVKQGKAHLEVLRKIKAGDYLSMEPPEVPYIPEQDRSPAVLELLEMHHLLLDEFRELTEEFARLKK